jgi:hypothetical protein
VIARAFALAPLALAVALQACRTAPSVDTVEPSPPPSADAEQVRSDPPVPPERDLPAGWENESTIAFEHQVEAIAAAGGASWSAAAREALSRALAPADQSSVRAAVLLAHDPSAGSTEALLARLEQRERAGSRALEGSDIVAAAALEGRLDESRRARVLQLVEGKHPHPDLEVRVECARVLLLAGDAAVIPFLFRVLRVQTPDQDLDPPDWEPTTTLFWVKFRAAEVLSARAGLPMSFRPDASFVDQAEQARRLADALDYTVRRRR